MNAPRVLIVDDDPDFGEITRTVLQAHGFEVASAAGGRQALDAMRRQRPDVVVLDVMMNGATDGAQVSHVVHEDPDLTGIPILMVTSIMDTPLASQFPTDEALPVEGFLRKPVNPKELAERVQALVKR